MYVLCIVVMLVVMTLKFTFARKISVNIFSSIIGMSFSSCICLRGFNLFVLMFLMNVNVVLSMVR